MALGVTQSGDETTGNSLQTYLGTHERARQHRSGHVLSTPVEGVQYGCKQWDGRPHPITAWMCHSEGFPHYASNRSLQMEIKTIGIDLAKNVFQVHAVAVGWSRDDLLAWMEARKK